jgi:Flp pilus assembly protein protease CpaA
VEIFFGAFIIACFAAAVCDFLVYKIPNVILLFIIVLFVLKVLLFQSVKDLLWPVVAFGGVLFVGFVLYLFKWIGAGDAKFIAVVSLWASQKNLLFFLMMMSIAGGALALMYLKFHPQIFGVQQKILSRLKSVPYFANLSNPSEPKAQKAKQDEKKTKNNMVVPYGVAVFVGALILFFIEK